MTALLKDIDFFQMGQDCLGHCARRTANLLTRHYNRYLAPHGLELTQVQLLSVLAGGSAQSASDVARLLGIDRSTLARNLRPLEAAGLIRREAGPGRAVVPVLSAQGENLVIELHAVWQRAQEELEAELGTVNSQMLRQNMSALRKAVRTLDRKDAAPTERDSI